MRRDRLRPEHSTERLQELYPRPHRHDKWADHRLRIEVTAAFARCIAREVGCNSGADLSCGDGATLKSIELETKIFGDMAPGHEMWGPLELTLDHIPVVDLYVCTETLEHLNDPDTVLKQIAAKAKVLVLSTPVNAWDDENEEHYWAWDVSAVEKMLRDAGWTVDQFMLLENSAVYGAYTYGIWGCHS